MSRCEANTTKLRVTTGSHITLSFEVLLAAEDVDQSSTSGILPKDTNRAEEW